MKYTAIIYRGIRILFLSAILSVTAADITEFIKIKTSFDFQEIDVKQQLLYTVDIIYQGTLIEPALPPPEITEAVVLQAGDVQTGERIINNKKFRYITLSWAIYPRYAGTLFIPSMTFSGRHEVPADPVSSGWLGLSGSQTFSVIIPSHTISVKPTQGTEDISVCHDLFLSESWSSNPNRLGAGETIQRIITLEAKGLPDLLLPELSMQTNPLFSSVLQSDTSENVSSITGINSRRTTVFNVTPSKAGNIIIPALTLHWKNPKTQVHKTVSLPSKQITVMGNKLLPTAAPSSKPHLITNKPGNEPHLWNRIKYSLAGLLIALIILLCVCSIKKLLKKNNNKTLSLKNNKKEKKEEKNQWKKAEAVTWNELQKACHSHDLKQIRVAFIKWSKNSCFIEHSNHDPEQMNTILFRIDFLLFSSHEYNRVDIENLVNQLYEMRLTLFS